MFEKFFKKPKNKVETAAQVAAVGAALMGAPEQAKADAIPVVDSQRNEMVTPSASNEQKPIVDEKGSVDLERVRTSLGLSTEKTPVNLEREVAPVELNTAKTSVDVTRETTPVEFRTPAEVTPATPTAEEDVKLRTPEEVQPRPLNDDFEVR